MNSFLNSFLYCWFFYFLNFTHTIPYIVSSEKNQVFFFLLLSKSICFGVFAPGESFVILQVKSFFLPLEVTITGCPCSSVSIDCTVACTFLKRPTSTLSPVLISTVNDFIF